MSSPPFSDIKWTEKDTPVAEIISWHFLVEGADKNNKKQLQFQVRGSATKKRTKNASHLTQSLVLGIALKEFGKCYKDREPGFFHWNL